MSTATVHPAPTGFDHALALACGLLLIVLFILATVATLTAIVAYAF